MTPVLKVYNLFFRYSILLGCLVIFSCGGHHKPAPIRNLSTDPVNEKLTQSGRYNVRKRDTLYSISFRYGLDFQKLARLNGIKKPYTIYPGQILRLRQTSNPHIKKSISDKSAKYKKNSKVVSTNKKNNAAPQQSVQKPREPVIRGHKDKQPIASFDSKKKVTVWLWPVKNRGTKKVISGKGEQQGIDILGTLGESVRASAAGRVVYSGNGLVGYGNLIIIKHSQSYLSAYAHNDRILVKEKSLVSAGQKIATMGKNSTGQVQLHFEIRYQGKPVNPLKYLQSSN